MARSTASGAGSWRGAGSTSRLRVLAPSALSMMEPSTAAGMSR